MFVKKNIAKSDIEGSKNDLATKYIANKRLKQLRVSQKLRHKDVAAVIDRNPMTYCQYELGYRTPSDAIKKKLADFYGVTVDYIFFDQLEEKE